MNSFINITNENGNFIINQQYINPIGTIVCFAGQTVPLGWILCDGSEISKSEYPDLFSVIGNTYGTPTNSSNFILPNLQQRIPLGKSNSNNLGATGGNSTINLLTNQLPSHNHTGTTDNAGSHGHTATDAGHNHTYDDAYFAENTGGGTNVFGTSAGTDSDNEFIYTSPAPTTSNGYASISVSSNGDHSHTFTTNSTGNGDPINIMNPYLVLNYLIKY
jgi:microcystin-dependent protein